MISEKDRVKYYLNDIKNKKDTKLINPLNVNTIIKSKKNSNAYEKYWRPLMEELIKYNFQEKLFMCKPGDITKNLDNYYLVKNRTVDDKKSIILRCFNTDRHWELYYNKPKDIPFDEKTNKIFWRGTTNGLQTNKGNRYDLVYNWFEKNKNIDVGFSNVNLNIKTNKKYLKDGSSKRNFLTYKYILSVEGNDKDSGINWKLNSNSLVFMAKPTKVSWLMEDKLIPNYHYILLKDDFSDLYNKYIWCENNQSKCKEIINNANKYMSMFSDVDKEKKIEKKVLEEYFKKVN